MSWLAFCKNEMTDLLGYILKYSFMKLYSLRLLVKENNWLIRIDYEMSALKIFKHRKLSLQLLIDVL